MGFYNAPCFSLLNSSFGFFAFKAVDESTVLGIGEVSESEAIHGCVLLRKN